MRRINIVKDGKIETKSFLTMNDLSKDLFNSYKIDGIKASMIIWDLPVGKSYTEKGYRFSINSKRRVANQLYDGTIIGVTNDNN